ncbi:MAG: ferritin family protein [Patescibacteria group bacterium]|nr:ferritin family protein [Patescibacteria group bacterium]MEA2097561.1 ferritin family protein [Patescibacteria group bacterium]
MLETYNLNLFRCELCSGVIFAEHKSSTCPLCGAHDDYIIRAQDWEDRDNIKNISKISKENLENAMELEIENAKFYRCAMSYAQDMDNKSIFQGLSRIEMEHVFLISKVLKKPKSDVIIQDICFRLDNENIKKSLKLGEKTKAFYTKAYNQAAEPRIKEIFFGLLEVEGDHIELFKERM